MQARLCTTTEAATREHGLDCDLLCGQPQYFRNRALVGRLHLTSVPRDGAVCIPPDIAIERLHGGMGEIGKHIARLHQLASLAACGLHIAFLANDRSRRFGELEVLGNHLLAAACFGCALVPSHGQRFAPLKGRPHAGSVDGVTTGNRLNRDHTLYAKGSGGVDLPGSGAETARSCDDDGQHARFRDIDGISRAAVDFGRRVEALGRALATDQSKHPGILQRHTLRYRQLRCRCRKLSEVSAASAR